MGLDRAWKNIMFGKSLLLETMMNLFKEILLWLRWNYPKNIRGLPLMGKDKNKRIDNGNGDEFIQRNVALLKMELSQKYQGSSPMGKL